MSSGQIPTSLPEVVEVPRTPDGEKGCESCLATSATRWYQWGPAHEHCRLCNFCYTYWRKYGGLKLPTRWGRAVGPVPITTSIIWCVCSSPEASDKKAGVMTAASLLQRKLNKGQSSLLSSARPILLSLLSVDRPSGVPRAFKKTPRYVTARKTGDIVPPVPFCMKPTPHTLFIRQRLGGRNLIRAARHPNILISPKSSPKPSCELAHQYILCQSMSVSTSSSGDTTEVYQWPS